MYKLKCLCQIKNPSSGENASSISGTRKIVFRVVKLGLTLLIHFPRDKTNSNTIKAYQHTLSPSFHQHHDIDSSVRSILIRIPKSFFNPLLAESFLPEKLCSSWFNWVVHLPRGSRDKQWRSPAVSPRTDCPACSGQGVPDPPDGRAKILGYAALQLSGESWLKFCQS